MPKSSRNGSLVKRNVKHMIAWSWINKLLELCYPPRCFFCDEPLVERESLCDRCTACIVPIEPPFCEVCGEPFDGVIGGSFSCFNCSDITLDFDFAIAAVRSSSEATELVHQLKYRRQLHLSVSMAELMAERFLSEPRFANKAWTLVPVPLHWRRKSKRGFNQAAELAKHVSKGAHLPIESCLVRKKASSPQARLGRAQRLNNLKDSFGSRRPSESLKFANVILVDDVLTTGSTAHECARVLKSEGHTGEIAVLTFMRG